jgi:hypothetical protein
MERLIPASPFVVLIPGALGFVGSIAGAMQFRLAHAGGGISASLSFLQQFAPVFLFAWTMGWYLLWAARRVRIANVALVLLLSGLAVGVAYSLIGTKTTVVTLAVLPLLAFWYALRRFPMKSIVALLLLTVFVVFPLYNTFRLTNSSLGTSSRLERTVRLAQKWDAQTYVNNSVFAFVRRMAVVTSVAAVVRYAGRYVPYRYGATLVLTPLALLIPRFLWPDKPDVSLGREFGITFDLVDPVDKETRIAPTVVGEFYWNFHIPGVLLGMLLLGASYRWFYQKFGKGIGNEPIRASFYLTLLSSALRFEGNVAMLVGGLVKTGVILVVLIALLERVGVLRAIADAAPSTPSDMRGSSALPDPSFDVVP